MKTLCGNLALVILLGAASTNAQHSTMPPGMSHEEHLRQMEKNEQLKHRGGAAMGFDQDKTVHHFLLRKTGGAIEVSAKDPADRESIDQIRSHFRDIAASFGQGLFDKPVATHGEMPPGAEQMALDKQRIAYRYEERANGVALFIETAAPATLAAIHDFMRYQIVEHQTGDPLTPPR
ncbi:MAG: hypothetical protein ABI024_16605 [Vicinamibacterales bacterium]